MNRYKLPAGFTLRVDGGIPVELERETLVRTATRVATLDGFAVTDTDAATGLPEGVDPPIHDGPPDGDKFFAGREIKPDHHSV